jgi:predicted dehydrogenase
MLKIGVFGAGHLGKIHIKCLQLAKSYFDIVGFYDPNPKAVLDVEQSFGIKGFHNPEDLLNAIEAADIVSPTFTHFELALRALKKGKHVFIEKPVTKTTEEAEILVQLSEEKKLKIQVGHVERFNPALLALGHTNLNPMFIEAHRLAPFNPRGTDVSVILDLMIHDLDIILNLVPSEVKKVEANGVAIVSKSPDITNARITFENGCVANVTSSRISMKQMRKMRLFQTDAYITLDFLEKKAQIIKLSDEAEVDSFPLSIDTETGKKYIQIEQPVIQETNAIQMELESFASCILQNTPPKVSIHDGYKALHLANQIQKSMEENLK